MAESRNVKQAILVVDGIACDIPTTGRFERMGDGLLQRHRGHTSSRSMHHLVLSEVPQWSLVRRSFSTCWQDVSLSLTFSQNTDSP